MKTDVLVSLIREVVKSEVKKQVKNEVIKLINSGDITLNTKKTVENTFKKKSSLSEMLDITPSVPIKSNNVRPNRQLVKDPLLNEILSQTEPFTSAHRVSGANGNGLGVNSILDSLSPSVSMEDGWETMDYRNANVPQQSPQIESSDNPLVDSLAKALTRDYRELVKRF